MGREGRVFSGALILALVPAAGISQDVFIAGIDPSIRPTDAPVVSEMSKDASWFPAALSGVEPPYPDSLNFLEDQGAWFTPFTRPGATGPYDIRNWY